MASVERETPDSEGPGSCALALAHRIWRPLWADEDRFCRLLELLQTHREAVDELSLFDHYVHVPGEPLAEAKRNAEMLRKRMHTARAAGFDSIGVNVIATLGHGMQSGFRDMPFSPTVGHDGEVAESSPCPNRPDFRAYVRDYYRLMAGAGPDFIWVDDDFRAVSHGVRYPCFCSFCLKQFGHRGGREELVGALNEPDEGELRREWTEFWADSLEQMASAIRGAVRSVDEDIELGLMTIGYSNSTYGGYPIGRWMEALHATRGRPGHGYYSDRRPRDLLDKTVDVARQVRDYPARVRTIQYELENWPYTTLDKSARTVVNECTLALMVGCNGVAFNAISEVARRFEEYEPLLEAVAARRETWEALIRAGKGLPLVGLWPADHRSLMAERRVGEKGWFAEERAYDIQKPNELMQMGLPFTARREAACGTVLSGRLAEAFAEEELRRMLAGAALMDQDALAVLWERGLGELTGVRPGENVAGCWERFTDHPLNGEYADDGRRVQPHSGAVLLQPVGDGVHDLAHAVGQADGEDRGICLSAFENGLGGRVAVATYEPWRRLGRVGKRRQLTALVDWLTRGDTPILIETTARVAPFVRREPHGEQVAVALLNASFDPTDPLKVRIRARLRQICLVRPEARLTLESELQGEETVVTVPSVDPWSVAVLLGW